MIKTIDKALNPLLFQILILVATACTLVSSIHTAYGGYVKYVLLVGILVCAWELIRKKFNCLVKDKASIVALCFAIFYAVSVVLNRDSCFGSNIKQLVYMVVFFLLLFFKSEGNIKLNMKVLSIVVTLSTFILSILAILVALQRNERIFNSNTLGAVSVISILVSLYLIFAMNFKQRWLRIVFTLFLSVNILIQFFAIVLSESRGSLYSFILTLGIIVFIAITKNFKREKYSMTARTAIAMLLCIISMLCVIGISTVVSSSTMINETISFDDAKYVDSDTKQLVEDNIKRYKEEAKSIASFISVNFLTVNEAPKSVEVSEESDFLTGRLRIWKACFETFLKKPIFGYTREASVDAISQTAYNNGVRSRATFRAIQGGGVHNEYLTILSSSGIVGSLCFVLLISIVLIRFIKIFFKKEKIDMEILFSFAISMYFFMSEMVESRILYTVSFFNVVFWLYFGYLNYFTLKGTEIREEKY